MSNNRPVYGIGQPLRNLFPAPIVSTRAPLTTDKSYPIGQQWTNKNANTAYVLTSVVANVATWQEITNAGGGGAIAGTSLVITAGPISLTGVTTIVGTTNINTTGAAVTSVGSTTGASGIVARVGTGNFSLDGVAGSTYSIGASTTTGTISIGGTGAQTGTISIAPGTGAQQVLIADSNTGVKQVAIAAGTVANIVTMGSTTGAASTTISGGTLGISLNTAAPSVATGGIFVLQGAVPFRIMCGAGAPNNNLAINVGDLYINSTGSGVANRMYIASGAGSWVNLVASA